MAQKAASKTTKQWCPAIYARLSKEDLENKKKDISLSIDHQIDILKDYVKAQGWQAPKVFFDDDRTGTNFDRKGFQDMYAEAKKGNINVIIIKDTSRFGRNWVQSGLYFEKIEEMGIRFISIQESLDTADPKCPALKMLPFYFIFNEWHSATTSEKVRTVFKKQAEQGKHFSGSAPYGYVKDPGDKYKLIVDPYAAGIVRRIFELRLQKIGYRVIAKMLNAEGYLSPSGYKVEKRIFKPGRPHADKWSLCSVSMILNNPAYCGDIANGKVENISYKNQKKVKKPVDEWIIAKDMHEPIVSREVWEKCQAMRASESKRIRSTSSEGVVPFSGLLKCCDCGCNLTRTTSQYKLASGEKKILVGYNCSAYSRKGITACTSHYITEKDLKALVIADIREKAGELLQDETAARERFYAIKSQSSGTQLTHDRRALIKVNKRLEELDALMQAAFEKSVLGGDSSDMFTEYARKYETEKRELAAQAETLSESIERQSQTENDVETFIALLKNHVDITELDRATAVELIDRIVISANTTSPREIVIYYNFMGNVEEQTEEINCPRQ